MTKIILAAGPNEGDDLVEWIENHGDAATPESMVEEINAMVAAASEAKPAADVQSLGIEIRTAGNLVAEFTQMRKSIIEGLLRLGEILNLIATSKARKSWLVLALALSVCMGWKWLGKFWTRQGRVLVIDNELHCETIAERVRTVADAMHIPAADYSERLSFVSLRGQLVDLNKLATFLLTLKPGDYDLIILDAFYRFLPVGVDENANGDITALYNTIDSVLARLGAAVVVVHHSSKGDQSGKSVTDTGSGAGAMSRAADTHVIMRAHEVENAVVFEAVARSWPAPEPCCLRFEFPLWVPADELDPNDLKRPKPQRKAQPDNEEAKAEARQQKEQAARLKVLEVFAARPDGDTESKLSAACGMSPRVYGPINAGLLEGKFIVACRVKKGHASYDGFKLSEAGLAELRQLRQLRQNTDSSAVSAMTPTTALSLESGVSRRSQQTTRDDEKNGLFA